MIVLAEAAFPMKDGALGTLVSCREAIGASIERCAVFGVGNDTVVDVGRAVNGGTVFDHVFWDAVTPALVEPVPL